MSRRALGVGKQRPKAGAYRPAPHAAGTARRCKICRVDILTALAASIAIITGLLKGGAWLRKKLTEHKALRARGPQAALPSPASLDEPYPVRFACWGRTDFHPDSGYAEGLEFELFNASDNPVLVKGFGLEISIRANGDWHAYEQARTHPRRDFPVRLNSHEALDGYIDTEALVEELSDAPGRVLDWDPYVELAGYGKQLTDIEPEERRILQAA